MLYVVDTDDMGGVVAPGGPRPGGSELWPQPAQQSPRNPALLGRARMVSASSPGPMRTGLKSFPFREDYAVPWCHRARREGGREEQGAAPRPTIWKSLSLTPGGMLALSADGRTPGTAVLWASLPRSGSANHEVRPGILRAFDAADVRRELWNSRSNRRPRHLRQLRQVRGANGCQRQGLSRQLLESALRLRAARAADGILPPARI